MRDYLDLMESHSYSILLESPQRAAWLLQNFGPKREEAYQAVEPTLPALVKTAIEGQEAADLPSKIIAYIMAADPTQQKAYSRWIALRFLKDHQKLEDINEQLRNNLTIFQRAAAARRIPANLDAIRTFAALFELIEPFVLGQR